MRRVSVNGWFMEIIYAFIWLYGQIVSRLWNKKKIFFF